MCDATRTSPLTRNAARPARVAKADSWPRLDLREVRHATHPNRRHGFGPHEGAGPDERAVEVSRMRSGGRSVGGGRSADHQHPVRLARERFLSWLGRALSRTTHPTNFGHEALDIVEAGHVEAAFREECSRLACPLDHRIEVFRRQRLGIVGHRLRSFLTSIFPLRSAVMVTAFSAPQWGHITLKSCGGVPGLYRATTTNRPLHLLQVLNECWLPAASVGPVVWVKAPPPVPRRFVRVGPRWSGTRSA